MEIMKSVNVCTDFIFNKILRSNEESTNLPPKTADSIIKDLSLDQGDLGLSNTNSIFLRSNQYAHHDNDTRDGVQASPSHTLTSPAINIDEPIESTEQAIHPKPKPKPKVKPKLSIKPGSTSQDEQIEVNKETTGKNTPKFKRDDYSPMENKHDSGLGFSHLGKFGLSQVDENCGEYTQLSTSPKFKGVENSNLDEKISPDITNPGGNDNINISSGYGFTNSSLSNSRCQKFEKEKITLRDMFSKSIEKEVNNSLMKNSIMHDDFNKSKIKKGFKKKGSTGQLTSDNIKAQIRPIKVITNNGAVSQI